MKHRKDMQKRAVIAAAALLFSGFAFAQSPALTAPNNSAGTTIDTPATLTPQSTLPRADLPTRTESSETAFMKLDPTNRGYVTRQDLNQLPGNLNFDEADRNRDGHLNGDEFQRAWNDYDNRGQ